MVYFWSNKCLHVSPRIFLYIIVVEVVALVVTENFIPCWKVLYIEICFITLQRMYAEYTWRRSSMERPLFIMILKPACTFTWLKLLPLLTSSCCCHLTVWSLFYYTAIKSSVHILVKVTVIKYQWRKLYFDCALCFSFFTVSKNCIIMRGPPSCTTKESTNAEYLEAQIICIAPVVKPSLYRLDTMQYACYSHFCLLNATVD